MKIAKLQIIIIFLLGLRSLSVAQFPDTTWTRAFGSVGYDYGRDIANAKDKGYIICGEVIDYSFGSRQLYLVRIDENGDTLWTQTYGNEWSDRGHGVCCLYDDGFAAIGYTAPNGNNGFDIFVVRTDSQGDALWTRHYGGVNNEMGKAIVQTEDGGFALFGATDSYGAGQLDMYLVKIDSLGNQLWHETYGGSNIDYGLDIKQTNDGGFILAGSSRSFTPPMNEMYLVKTDASGNVEWQEHYGYSNKEEATAVIQAPDNGFVAAGRRMTYSFHEQIYVIKTDVMGGLVWEITYGGIRVDWAHDIIQNMAGNYIVSGFTASIGYPCTDIILLSINDSGDVLGNWIFDYYGYESGESILESDYGEYVIAGYTSYNWENGFDVFALKTRVNFTDIADNNTQLPVDSFLRNYPNPFNASTTIKFGLPEAGPVTVSIYDILGRKVETLMQGEQPAGYHQVVWDAGKRSSGMYFYRIEAGDYAETKKMVLLK